MEDTKREENRQVGHNSTTIPGGEKDLPTGDPGRTPGKAEGDERTADESLKRQEG
ncbi:MAG: hypothetical protein LC800_22100 [Acidobacteria bacterium]|nr:hypothetical protein [Acidobacteriota bacterium]